MHLLVSSFLFLDSVGRGSEKLASVSSFFRCPWQLAKSLVAKKVLIEKNKHSKNPMNMLKNIWGSASSKIKNTGFWSQVKMWTLWKWIVLFDNFFIKAITLFYKNDSARMHNSAALLSF